MKNCLKGANELQNPLSVHVGVHHPYPRETGDPIHIKCWGDSKPKCFYLFPI